MTRALFLLLLLAVTTMCAAEPVVPVGFEERLDVLLPGPPLKVQHPGRAAPVVVRIVGTHAHPQGHRYELRYVGLVPGTHDLRSHFVTQEGAPVADLPPVLVRIGSELPAEHQGELTLPESARAKIFGGYRWLIAGAVALWAFGGLVLVLRRRPPPAPVVAAAPQVPSIADRLRPLVEQAARGSLSTDQKAELERLLLGHWQQRLGLASLDAPEAMRHLREHSEAGQLLRTLEDWLHRPPGSVAVDPVAVLAPYASPTSPPA